MAGALRLSPLGALQWERAGDWPGERDKRKAPATPPHLPLSLWVVEKDVPIRDKEMDTWERK
ncbi:hypothetical protein KSF_077970 [Reticulibacter mediterranei]|uniref:Uncharacterized protein n=1 Tax=Reticulibacter mediterranei TaxID=2778369 RepID=A0A8J3N478_9CHLR|nr:hypothetical protein KSF_077970 [Reticulibacter mediterranei]